MRRVNLCEPFRACVRWYTPTIQKRARVLCSVLTPRHDTIDRSSSPIPHASAGHQSAVFLRERALSWELAAAHAVRCYHYFMPVLAILGRARVAA